MSETDKQLRSFTKSHRFQDWLAKNESKFDLKLNPSISTKFQIVENEKTKKQLE